MAIGVTGNTPHSGCGESRFDPSIASLKVCTGCKVTKPRSEFHKQTRRSDGLQSYCKACKSQMNRDYERANPSRISNLIKHRAKRRAVGRDYIRNYLEAHPCVDCGEADWVVLEFDHVRGDKVCPVSVLLSTALPVEKIEAEIAKCDVRCANCHRRVTYGRAGSWRSELPQKVTLFTLP